MGELGAKEYSGTQFTTFFFFFFKPLTFSALPLEHYLYRQGYFQIQGPLEYVQQ